VGWHRAVEIARHADVWVICKQQDYQKDIERYLAASPRPPGLHFCFLPNTPLELRLKRIPGLWYLAYNLWHRRAYRRAVSLHREVGFDLAHQLTLAGFREPGYLWKLPVPFVWGPVGGTQNYPAGFLRTAGLRGALREGARAALNRLQFRLSRRVRCAARGAAAIFAANTTARRDFMNVHGRRTYLMPTCGTDATRAAVRASGTPGGPLRILWCGVLEHHKALHLLIAALARVPESVDYQVRILGAGPLEKRWRRLARRAGIEARCEWLGWVPHKEVWAHYEWADVFAFTSLRDTSAHVVLEAMTQGVPVICLDHQGAGDVVTRDCGIKIPVTTPAEVVSRLCGAIVSLASDRVGLAALGNAARARAERFQWSRQARKIVEVYEKVLEHAWAAQGGSGPRPARSRQHE